MVQQEDKQMINSFYFNKNKQKRPLFVESKGMFKNNKRKLFN